MNANDAPSKVLETVVETWKVAHRSDIPHREMELPAPQALMDAYREAREAAHAAKMGADGIDAPIIRVEADITVRVYYTKEVDRG